MQAITFDQAWDLIKRSSFQTIDGYVATIFSGGGDGDECPPFTGDPANELLDIQWEDDAGQCYGMALIEEGIEDQTEKIWFDEEEGILYLPDDDGDADNPVAIQLYAKMGRKFLQ